MASLKSWHDYLLGLTTFLAMLLNLTPLFCTTVIVTVADGGMI